MKDPTKTPLCLVSCGSFSPITCLHLRMFEMAADHVRLHTDFELVCGYFSPVSDAYKKAGLASAEHRLRMCELAADHTSSWLMVDPWEAMQGIYQPTAVVLDRFSQQINGVVGGVETASGERKQVRVALLAGADLIQTMSTPGVWSDEHLDYILGQCGTFIVERSGTDMDDALATLQRWKHNIHVVPQLVHNDVSSSKVRHFLRCDMSVRYLIPSLVIEYIEQRGLYREHSTASGPASSLLDKGKIKAEDAEAKNQALEATSA